MAVGLGAQGDSRDPTRTACQPTLLELSGRHQLGEALDRAHVLAGALGPFAPVREKLGHAFAVGLGQQAALFDPLSKGSESRLGDALQLENGVPQARRPGLRLSTQEGIAVTENR